MHPTADLGRIICGLPAVSIEVVVPVDMLRHGERPAAGTAATCRPSDGASGGSVAEIPGHGFLTPENARELLAEPGTTLHRLLTDPADGRLLERSTPAYRPDATMLAQVRAADRSCRGQGCLVPAHRCELDHAQPFGSGGPTAETNLNAKHPRHHQLKTERFWSSVMDATRVVTWTTLFDRMYCTGPHDYRQYAAAAGPSAPPSFSLDAPPGPPHPGHGTVDPLTVEDPDLRGRLVYAALCTRSGQDRWLEALDNGDLQGWMPRIHRGLEVFHRVGGRRRPGPPSGQPTVEDLLRPPGGETRPPAPLPGPPPVDDPPPF